MDGLLSKVGMFDSVEGSVEKLEAAIPQWSKALGCNLVVTLGSKGALGFTVEDGAFFAEAPTVSAVDTVGAGDCFVGYFVSLMSEGNQWQGALKGAVTAASESVQRPGAQSSYPSRTDAEKFRTLATAV